MVGQKATCLHGYDTGQCLACAKETIAIKTELLREQQAQLAVEEERAKKAEATLDLITEVGDVKHYALQKAEAKLKSCDDARVDAIKLFDDAERCKGELKAELKRVNECYEVRRYKHRAVKSELKSAREALGKVSDSVNGYYDNVCVRKIAKAELDKEG